MVLEQDPATAPLIKELIERYASGIESYDTITKWARKSGLTTKKGNPLVRSTIEHIIKHPAYCGLIRWQGKECVGVHEPLVSMETWKKAQDIREGRTTNTGFGGKDFAYRGLVRCACGELLTGELKKGKYVYYHCTGRKREICGRPYIAESKITDAYCQLLQRLRIPDFAMPLITEGLATADKDRRARKTIRERELTKAIAEMESRLEQLYLDKIAGEITAEFYRATRAKWESETIEKKLELAAMSRVEASVIDQTMRLFELASSAYRRFKNADSSSKRELINLMCSNSLWRDGKLEVELNPLFDLMLNTVISELPKEEAGDEEQLVFTKSVNWWR